MKCTTCKLKIERDEISYLKAKPYCQICFSRKKEQLKSKPSKKVSWLSR